MRTVPYFERRQNRTVFLLGAVLLNLVAGCVVEDEDGGVPSDTLESAEPSTVDGLVFCLYGGAPRVVERAEECETDSPRLVVRSNEAELEVELESEILDDLSAGPAYVAMVDLLELAVAVAEDEREAARAQAELKVAVAEAAAATQESEVGSEVEAAATEAAREMIRILLAFFGQDTNLNGLYDVLEETDGDGVLNFDEDQDADGIVDIATDDDGDGVPNPMEDDDGDTVMNVVDLCPTEAGEPVNDGCPAVIGEVILVDPATTVG